MFELWSQEISGSGTSAYYRTTLTRAMTEPRPLTYDEHKVADAALLGYLPDPDWTDSAQEIYACLAVAIVKGNATGFTPTGTRDLEGVSR